MDKTENILDNSKFYTNEEFVNKFGSKYNKTTQYAVVCKDETLFNHYKSENTITITNCHGVEKKVSEDLILDVVNNKYGLYSYLINNFTNPIGIAIKMCYFNSDGDQIDNIIISLAELRLFLSQIDSNKFEKKTLAPFINSITSYTKMEKTYANSSNEFVLDNEIINEKISTLIKILFSTEEEFNEFIKDNKNARKVCYMIVEFVEKERILDKYALPEEIYKRYMAIKQNELVDIETINSDIKSADPDGIDNKIISELQLDDSLINFVKKYSKSSYSNLETAIHLYVRLCELIVERPYEYIFREKKDSMTFEDAFYFRLIYAAILKKFGINYNISRNTFIVGEYRIYVGTNVNMDQMSLEDGVNNLKCVNSMEITRNKFDEVFHKVLDNILRKEKQKEKFIIATEMYEKNNYKKINELNMTDAERVELLVRAILESDLTLYDSIDYQKKVLNISDENIEAIFVNTEEGIKTILKIIKNEEQYFFIIDPLKKDKVKRVSREKLDELFELGIYKHTANTSSDKRGR